MEAAKDDGTSRRVHTMGGEAAQGYPQNSFQEHGLPCFRAGMMPVHQKGALPQAQTATLHGHQTTTSSNTNSPPPNSATTSGSTSSPTSCLSEGNQTAQTPPFVQNQQQPDGNWGVPIGVAIAPIAQQYPVVSVPTVSTHEEQAVSESPDGPQHSSAYPSAIKLLVSNNVAGSIIGRAGQTISDLQSQSSARIKLSQTGDFYPGTQDRVCLVQGQLDTVKLAVRLLLERFYMLQEQQHSQQMAWQQKSNDEQQSGYGGFDFVVRILVPSSSCGMIIGKAGSNIKHMEEASGVSSVRLSPKDSSDTSSPSSAAIAATSERVVTVTGPTFESCLMCLDIILDGMMVNQETSRYSNMTTSYSRAPLQGPFAVMPNPGSAPDRPVLAVHIGPTPESPMWDAGSQYSNQFAPWKRSNSSPDLGGQLVWDQQQGPLRAPPENTEVPMSGRQPPTREPLHHYNAIYTDRPTSFQSDMAPMMSPGRGRLSSVTPPPMYLMPPAHPNLMDPGSIPNNLSAPDLLAIQLQGSLRLEASPSPAAVDYSHFAPQLPQPTPPGFTAQILVPDSLVGSILGRGGRTLNELQMHSGTRIRISQRGEFVPGTRNRIVTIRGPTAQSVSLAQYLMNQRMVLPPTSSYSGQPPFHPPSVAQEPDFLHPQENVAQHRNDLQTAHFSNPYVDSSTFQGSSQSG